ncbi:MAG: DUF1822 family protein, partial [Cyanobacteriota bacterium]|nr:DUF1822 family protein [Cyanobacteriota bacterium]
MHSLFTLPITNKDRKIAEDFSALQSQPDKQQQVYYNSLAVLAVNYYCQCMEISTDFSQSDSWNPIIQSLGNCADLSLGNLGKIECRPVPHNASSVTIPAEVWANRIGYLAIQFDEAFTQAKFIGFLEKIRSEEIPINQWRSLDDFLDVIAQLETVYSTNIPINLKNWLQGKFDRAWEAIETLAQPAHLELGWRFRQRYRATSGVERGRILSLEYSQTELAMILGLTPKTSSELDISVELYPTRTHAHLPKTLKLMILDYAGQSVMQAEAGGSEKLLFKFSG